MNKQMTNALAQGDHTPVVLQGVSNEVRITSIELVEVINTFRAEEGDEIKKQHNHLMRDIRKEIQALERAGIDQSNFGLISYKDNLNREKPCYSMNKAGALQMLNKESAVVRYKTVQYIEKLERQQQDLSPQLQFLINLELEQKKIQQQLVKVKKEAEQANMGLTTIKNVMLFNRYNWDTECNLLIYSIAHGCKQYAQKIREEVYRLVEERGRADLKQRVANKQRRLRAENANEATISSVDYMSVIADDVRLKEIYIGIVKELAFKYGVVLEGDNR